MNRPSQVAVVLTSLIVATLLGCREDPRVAALRSRFVLEDEPAGAVAVSQAIADASDSDGASDDSGEVVVVGRISTNAFDPWAEGQAAFMLSEALPDHGGAGHDAANCPFCKRRQKKAAETIATVQFKDDDGQVIPIDARELFELEDDQVVVVRGRRVNVQGLLFIVADGIHVRR